MKIEIYIEKLDNLNKGIGYYNNKIVFIDKVIPGDYIEAIITKEKKNYYSAKLIKFLNNNPLREEILCPYFYKCGGCNYLGIKDESTYKINSLKELFLKNKIDFKLNNYISYNKYNYRNKVSLKIKNKIVGYYESLTNTLVEIDYCYLLNNTINELISNIDLLNIIDGTITIRCNNKKEILLIIDTLNNIDYTSILDKYNIVGIILNDKLIYGRDYLYMYIDRYKYKVSYNSFFQVNDSICKYLLDYMSNIGKNYNNILDLYCGVGTLSIAVKNNDNYVLGVEIVENAIINARENSNALDKIEFICSDTSRVVDSITSKFDLVIVDPPRSGVSKVVLDKIIKEDISGIVYVSCNPLTLVRDINILKDTYSIKDINILNMFPNTKHIESIVVMERNKNKRKD